MKNEFHQNSRWDVDRIIKIRLETVPNPCNLPDSFSQTNRWDYGIRDWMDGVIIFILFPLFISLFYLFNNDKLKIIMRNIFNFFFRWQYFFFVELVNDECGYKFYATQFRKCLFFLTTNTKRNCCWSLKVTFLFYKEFFFTKSKEIRIT
jgi:hypothetical protein